jgi:hypothetical protein
VWVILFCVIDIALSGKLVEATAIRRRLDCPDVNAVKANYHGQLAASDLCRDRRRCLVELANDFAIRQRRARSLAAGASD